MSIIYNICYTLRVFANVLPYEIETMIFIDRKFKANEFYMSEFKSKNFDSFLCLIAPKYS
jgi:hypothetical protein